MSVTTDRPIGASVINKTRDFQRCRQQMVTEKVIFRIASMYIKVGYGAANANTQCHC